MNSIEENKNDNNYNKSEVAGRMSGKKTLLLDRVKSKVLRLFSITVDIDEKREKEIKNEALNLFRKISEMDGVEFSFEQLKDIVDNIYLTYVDSFKSPYTAGKYCYVFNQVILKKDVVNGELIRNKKTRMHELIHGVTGRKIKEYTQNGYSGLLEGETESIVAGQFDDGTSGIVDTDIKINNNSDAKIHFNFPLFTSYKMPVCLVRQMEIILGKTSINSILKGDRSFEMEFSSRYGERILDIVARAARKTRSFEMIDRRNRKVFDCVNIFRNAQNELMRVAFNTDAVLIKTPEDAEKYFEKLRQFELVRARFLISNNRQKVLYEDKTYVNYYNEKYRQVSDMLFAYGYDDECIDKHLNKYRYRRQEFGQATE